MCRLVETIKIKNGILCDLPFHLARAEKSRRELFGIAGSADIEEKLVNMPLPPAGVHKCRVLYRDTIEEMQIAPYVPRTVRSLKIVYHDDINYSYKFEDKKTFNALLARKGSCDDILIVKNGFITDTSFSNVAFFDGTTWVTPETCLLRGTKREKLLADGIIQEEPIRPDDLARFKKVSLINTMLDLGELIVAVEHIVEQ
jgi:4-amino-4-deoxychorismate lyase